MCRPCRRLYERQLYSTCPKKRARIKLWNDETVEKIRALIRDYLASHPCIDCGECDIIVLDFDHRDPTTKRFALGDAARLTKSVARTKAEIAKCDVRCANCHRRKTYKERGCKHRGHAPELTPMLKSA